MALMPDESGGWLLYEKPHKIVEVREANDVVPALAAVEKIVEDQGLHAVGFMAYEAAKAFDPAYQVHDTTGSSLPLLWFGLFRESDIRHLDSSALTPVISGEGTSAWTPSIRQDEYLGNISKIRDYLEQGETYQVNYTYRLRADFTEDPINFFLSAYAFQPSVFSMLMNTRHWSVLSFSPELFFHLNGSRLTMRPMKGTRPRGLTFAEDEALRLDLATSAKDRAENVMIVDMVRNDLGRIARVGSVKTTRLFDIESYPTVFQMTSTVEAEVDSSVTEILKSLFPCASITGAPKINTMRIIRELEPDPRGLYCGCIGRMRPGRQYQFSVAIRTAVVDHDAAMAEYGIGGGVVWDSVADEEWKESLVKARILEQAQEPFSLIETMLWKPMEGWFLLERHMTRLANSARQFGFDFDAEAILSALDALAHSLPPAPHKVRLLLSGDGFSLESSALDASPLPSPYRLRLAIDPVDSHNGFLYHKTTRRGIYDAARRHCGECDDVLLWNERGELTESCIANLALKFGGEWFTPPVESGLLPGTFRQELIEKGEINVRVINKDELSSAEEIGLINSVRGWIRNCMIAK